MRTILELFERLRRAQRVYQYKSMFPNNHGDLDTVMFISKAFDTPPYKGSFVKFANYYLAVRDVLYTNIIRCLFSNCSRIAHELGLYVALNAITVYIRWQFYIWTPIWMVL